MELCRDLEIRLFYMLFVLKGIFMVYLNVFKFFLFFIMLRNV